MKGRSGRRMPWFFSLIDGALASSCAGKIDEIDGEAREDRADRDEKWERERQTLWQVGPTYQDGRKIWAETVLALILLGRDLSDYHFTHREKPIIRPYDRWVVSCTVKDLIGISFQYQSHCSDVYEIGRLNQRSCSIPIHVWMSYRGIGFWPSYLPTLHLTHTGHNAHQPLTLHRRRPLTRRSSLAPPTPR
jgi:hypothetical protein